MKVMIKEENKQEAIDVMSVIQKMSIQEQKKFASFIAGMQYGMMVSSPAEIKKDENIQTQHERPAV